MIAEYSVAGITVAPEMGMSIPSFFEFIEPAGESGLLRGALRPMASNPQSICRQSSSSRALMRAVAAVLSCASLVLTACGGSQTQPEAASKGPSYARTCLVLSVGELKGIAHLGAIAALREQRVPIDCVVGTSMGALVGAMYAQAPQADTTARFRDFLAKYVEETKRDAGARGASTGLFALFVTIMTGGAAAPALAAGTAGYMAGASSTELLDHARVVKVFDTFVHHADIQFLPTPYATTYFAKGSDGFEYVVARDGNLAKAVGNSIANPLLFKGKDIRKADGLDPGLDRAAAVPVDDACRLFPDARLIAINVTRESAFFSSEMKCPLVEIRVDVGTVDVKELTKLDAHFEDVVRRGYDAVYAAEERLR